jgi:hypothetical protein
LDSIALVQRPESLGLNLAVVNEDVTALVRRDEPKPLGIIEPLHRTFWHDRLLTSDRTATGPVLETNTVSKDKETAPAEMLASYTRSILVAVAQVKQMFP